MKHRIDLTNLSSTKARGYTVSLRWFLASACVVLTGLAPQASAATGDLSPAGAFHSPSATDQDERAAPIRRSNEGVLHGRVVDDATSAAIVFANIGIPEFGLGTVGGEDGAFELAGAQAGATAVVSAIGYETQRVTIDSLGDSRVVRLTAVDLGFRESLTVTAESNAMPKVFGKKYKNERGYGFGFASGSLGAELGARIPIKSKTFIESAHFMVAHTGGERFLYRVNLYSIVGDEIRENLLTRNVLVAAEQERGTLTVDLREQGLIVESDVLLALEWIRDDSELGNANVMFRAQPRSKATLYHKITSQMPYRKVKRHSLGFYLVGYSLD